MTEACVLALLLLSSFYSLGSHEGQERVPPPGGGPYISVHKTNTIPQRPFSLVTLDSIKLMISANPATYTWNPETAGSQV